MMGSETGWQVGIQAEGTQAERQATRQVEKQGEGWRQTSKKDRLINGMYSHLVCLISTVSGCSK